MTDNSGDYDSLFGNVDSDHEKRKQEWQEKKKGRILWEAELRKEAARRDARQEEIQRNPELVTAGDLNNFYEYMPGGRSRANIINQLIDGERQQFAALLDKHERHSDRQLSQTPQQFFAAIDQILEEMNLMEKVKELVACIKGEMTPKRSAAMQELEQKITALNQDDPAYEQLLVQKEKLRDSSYYKHQLNELILPVYHKLRNMGYTHWDLVI